MSRSKSLIKNTGILTIAMIATQFVSFLLLPLYTGLLSTSEYGEIDIYVSLTMIIIPILTLQVEMALFRFFITEANESERKKIITTSFVIVGIILLLVSIIYWIIAIPIHLRYKTYLYFYYIAIVIYVVLLQFCRACGKNKVYGLASFLSSAIAVICNVFFLAGFHWKVEGILLSSIIAQSISIIYIIFRTKVYQYFDIKALSKVMAKTLLKYSFPLVFNQISSWTINFSDRLIILAVWGTGANGVYSLANKFSNIPNTFYNVFNIAWTENMIRSIEDNDSWSYINRVFNLSFNVYLALITGIVNLLPFFFNVLVNENYNEAYGHIPILLLAMFFSGMAANIGSIYIAYNKTKEVSITTVLAGICNIVVHLGLLKLCGLYAASISTLVSFSLLFLYRFIFVQKFFRLKIEINTNIPQLAIFVLVWFAYNIRNTPAIMVGLLLNLLYIMIMIVKNKHVIIRILKN